jgi:hypothetical protein
MREGSLLRHADPEFHLPQVIPWSDTLNLIKRKLGLISKPQQQQQQHQQQHHRPSSRGNGNSGRLPNRLLTIFNGCSIPTQIISEMDDPIVKVSYIQTNPKTGQDSVAMLCGQHFIHWIGSQKQCESGPPVKHALYDIQRMIYIQQHRIFIGCTSRAQLRILDQSGSLASSAGPMGDGSIENGFPVLCLAFITDRDQLIVGGIGGMKIYRLERRQDFLNNRYVFELQQQHEMKWPSSRWVRSACYWQNCIYLAIDTGVVRLRMVEDSITQDGEFNENIHAFSITDLLVVEQMQAVVSAAKDGQIIVWDHHGRIMARLQGGHTSSVTGLLLIDGRERLNLERDPRLPEDQLPYLVSSSLDGTVRIWNLLNFKCIER